MRERKSAIQYAKALFSSDPEGKNLRQYQRELEEANGILEHTPGMVRLLENPQIEVEERGEIVKTTFDSTVSPVLVRLMLLLLSKRKLHLLPEITEEFHHMVAKSLGIVEVNLISPWKISDSFRNELKQRLEKFVKHDIELHEEIDTSLLGGFRVVMASKMIDFSLRGRLQNLKHDLLS